MKVFRIVVSTTAKPNAQTFQEETVSESRSITEFPPSGEVRRGFEDEGLRRARFEYSDGTIVRYTMDE